MLNIENVNPFTNIKSDKFLCKTVSQNILSLCNSKKALLQAIRSTKYNNCHLIVGSYPYVCYFIKLLTKKAVFYKQIEKGDSRSDLPNLFINGSVLLVKKFC